VNTPIIILDVDDEDDDNHPDQPTWAVAAPSSGV
jgi:hypothetical protein